MKILAIESSCDETAAAVVQEEVILSNVVATQMKVHAEHGGVVPELAAREHLSNVLPVVNQALSDAGMSAKNLDWIAATQGPGLPPALMVGYQAAQHMAFALGMPLWGCSTTKRIFTLPGSTLKRPASRPRPSSPISVWWSAVATPCWCGYELPWIMGWWGLPSMMRRVNVSTRPPK